MYSSSVGVGLSVRLLMRQSSLCRAGCSLLFQSKIQQSFSLSRFVDSSSPNRQHVIRYDAVVEESRVKFEQIRARHNLATMSNNNNNDDTTTPIPRFRAAQLHHTVVHPNLSASSLQKLRNKQHTRRPSIGQDGTTEPYSINRIRPLYYCWICDDLVESSAVFLAGQSQAEQHNYTTV